MVILWFLWSSNESGDTEIPMVRKSVDVREAAEYLLCVLLCVIFPSRLYLFYFVYFYNYSLSYLGKGLRSVY